MLVEGEDYFSATSLVEARQLLSLLPKRPIKIVPAHAIEGSRLVVKDDDFDGVVQEALGRSPVGEIGIFPLSASSPEDAVEVFAKLAEILKPFELERVQLRPRTPNLIEPIIVTGGRTAAGAYRMARGCGNDDVVWITLG